MELCDIIHTNAYIKNTPQRQQQQQLYKWVATNLIDGIDYVCIDSTSIFNDVLSNYEWQGFAFAIYSTIDILCDALIDRLFVHKRKLFTDNY